MAEQDLEALKEAARTAWLYTLPLIEIAATRQRSQSAPSERFGA